MIGLLLPFFFATRIVTLDGALQTAESNQPAMREARASLEISRARSDQSRAGLLPSVNLSGTFTRQSFNSVNLIAQPRDQWGMVNAINTAITGSQVIFDFGLISRWRAAQASARAAASTVDDERNIVRSNVRLSFFTARARRELVRVAQDALENQQKHLETVEGFVKVGARPEIDLAQSRGDTANARLARIRAENDYETAKSELNQAMGVEGPTDFDVSDDTVGPVDGEDEDTDALLSLALRARPDLIAAERQVDAARIGVTAARAAYGPTLSVAGRVTRSGPAVEHQVPNIRYDVSLNWPLFSGLLTMAQVHEAKGSLQLSEATRDALAQQVRLDLEKARLAVRAAKAEQGAASDALENASERLRLAEGRYQAGVGNILELDDAQLARDQAAAQKVQADYDLASARAQLLEALGRP